MGSEELGGIEAALRDLRMKYIETAAELQGLKRECIEETIALARSIPGIDDARIKECTETIDGIVIERAEVSVTGTEDAKIMLSERSPEIKQKYMPFLEKTASRMSSVERNIGAYIGKLQTFTVLNPLYERGIEAHAHIIIVHEGRIQEGQVHFSEQEKSKLDFKQHDAAMLEKVKERSLKSKCNVYVATHPSELATPKIIFSYAQKQVIERIGKNYITEQIPSIAKRMSLN